MTIRNTRSTPAASRRGLSRPGACSARRHPRTEGSGRRSRRRTLRSSASSVRFGRCGRSGLGRSAITMQQLDHPCDRRFRCVDHANRRRTSNAAPSSASVQSQPAICHRHADPGGRPGDRQSARLLPVLRRGSGRRHVAAAAVQIAHFDRRHPNNAFVSRRFGDPGYAPALGRRRRARFCTAGRRDGDRRISRALAPIKANDLAARVRGVRAIAGLILQFVTET